MSMDENFRTELETNFECIECGARLTFKSEIVMNANSAFKSIIKIKIFPCKICYEDNFAPLRKIQQGLKQLTDGKQL